MTIKEIRALTGLSQPKFCQKYHIPLNTFVRWEQGKREPPDYVVELLEFKVREDMKLMMKKSEIGKAEGNELLVDYINSVVSFHLNYNSGKNTGRILKHCDDLEKEIVARGILTKDDIKRVNGR